MITELVIVILYLSFFLDFLIWPISSEASTKSLASYKLVIRKLLLFGIMLLTIVGYLLPLAFAIYGLVHHPLDGSAFTFFGLAVAVGGRLFTLHAAYHLHSHDRSELLKYGTFRHSRNPITTGTHITFIGLCMIYPNWILLGFGIFYFLNLHFKILLEENFLRDRYGSSYEEYCKSTARYLLL